MTLSSHLSLSSLMLVQHDFTQSYLYRVAVCSFGIIWVNYNDLQQPRQQRCHRVALSSFIEGIPSNMTLPDIISEGWMTTSLMCSSGLMFLFLILLSSRLGERWVEGWFLVPSRVEPNWVVHSLWREREESWWGECNPGSSEYVSHLR